MPRNAERRRSIGPDSICRYLANHDLTLWRRVNYHRYKTRRLNRISPLEACNFHRYKTNPEHERPDSGLCRRVKYAICKISKCPLHHMLFLGMKNGACCRPRSNPKVLRNAERRWSIGLEDICGYLVHHA